MKKIAYKIVIVTTEKKLKMKNENPTKIKSTHKPFF